MYKLTRRIGPDNFEEQRAMARIYTRPEISVTPLKLGVYGNYGGDDDNGGGHHGWWWWWGW